VVDLSNSIRYQNHFIVNFARGLMTGGRNEPPAEITQDKPYAKRENPAER
jgi:hypothetical protein